MKKRITCLLAGIIIAVSGTYGQKHNVKSVANVPSAAFTGAPTTICACSSVQFTDASTNGPTQWRWYFPGAVHDTSTMQNPLIQYCIPGTFPVALVAVNSSGSDSIYVINYITVEQPVVVTVTPPSGGICVSGSGDSVCFTASGAGTGGTYTWTTTTIPSGLSCTNCASPCASPSVTTTYIVVGTNTLVPPCSSVPDTITVLVDSIMAKITGTDSICVGDSDVLIGSGGASPGSNYIWSTGVTTTEIVVSPTIPTVYSLTVTQGTCNSLAVFTVTPIPKPTFTIVGVDSVCKGACTYLTASETSPGSASIFVWFDGYSYDTTRSGQTYTLCPTASLNLHLYVTRQGYKGCTVDSVIPIKVTDLSAITFTGATNLCQGSTTTICVHGNGTQFVWSTGCTTSCCTVEPPGGSITYTVGIYDGACYKDTTFTIIVDTMPLIKFTGDTALCKGDSTVLHASGGLTYNWSNGSTADSIVSKPVWPQEFTTYTLVVTKGACSKDTTVTVKQYVHPNGKVVADTTICQYDTVDLMATGGNYYIWSPKRTGLSHYLSIPENDTDINPASPNLSTKYMVKVCTWGCCDTVYDSVGIIEGAIATLCCDTCVASGTPVTLTATAGNGQTSVTNWSGNDLSSNTGNSVIATPSVTSQYHVYLVNHATGCIHTDSVTISICNCTIFVPNIFSPNGDGVNDVLYVRSLCIKKIDFAIFDRWGNKVYETTDQDDGWDGTYKGKKMDMGVYVWYLNAVKEDGTVVNSHGNVALIR